MRHKVYIGNPVLLSHHEAGDVSAHAVPRWFCLLALPYPAIGRARARSRGLAHGRASPTKRTEVAAVTLCDKIYVVGGFEQPSLGNLMNLAITRIRRRI